ncbi:MAG: cytochrome c3 family protein, partial [Desulfobacterales bacterium]
KGKEGTCRYCHQKETDNLNSEKIISMRSASHLACIDCHQKTQAKNMDAGPVRCSGCHDLKEQQNIEKVAHVPRIKRGQPDVVLIKTGDQKGQEPRMMRVPFPHQAHEEFNDTCRVCHLASLKSCVSCHPLTTSNDSEDISIETAFHKMGHKSSCTGCHESKQQDKNCAGCHAFMGKARKQDLSSCVRCHMTPLPEKTGVLSTSEAASMARMMPKIWRETFGSTYQVTVPEKVIIQNLVDRYEPVEFPHQKIFNALTKQVSNSKLAQYFHYNKTTLCIGCHHNTPEAGKPPRCGNCHGKPFDKNNLFKPGIRASYHQQCIGCHQKMGIEKYLSCTACHKERKKQS